MERNSLTPTQLVLSAGSHMFSGSKHYIGQSSGDLSGLTRAGSALRTHLRSGYKERRTGRE